MLEGRRELERKTPFSLNYFFEMSQVVLLTLVLFLMFTLSHLEHGIAFIFPVPIAIFVIRYHVKDGIIPAILMIIGAALITHFLPINEGHFLRGLLVMTTSMSLGILHGILYKLRMKPLKEILILVGVELLFAIAMKIIFYFMKDPYYSFSIEFDHLFHNMSALFGLKEAEIFTKNAAVVFKYMVIPYTFALAFIEVLFTHMLIHVFIKYVYELTDEKAFHGLKFKMPRLSGIVYLIASALCVGGVIAMDYSLATPLLAAIIALFVLTLMATIFFLFQGVIFMMKLTNMTLHHEYSTFLFFVGLLFIIPFALLGAANVIFRLGDKLVAHRAKKLI